MENNLNTKAMGARAASEADPKGASAGAADRVGLAPSARPAAAAPPVGGLPNPLVIIRRVIAHWPVAAVVMVVGVIATAQVVRSRKPVFKSETVVFYRPGVLAVDGITPNDVLRLLATKLKEMLLAQSNLKKVLDETHLYKDIVDRRGYSDAVDLFRKNIDFKARSSDTFAISFQGSTPDEAQTITARLADMLVRENSKSRQELTTGSTTFLEAQKKGIDDTLAKLETERAQFMAAHPEFATESGDGAAVRAEQKKASAAAIAARRRAQVVGGGVSGPLVPLPGVPTVPGLPTPMMAAPVDPLLLAARSTAMNELISAKKDLAEKSVKFTDQHPDVRNDEARIAAAEIALGKAEDAIRAATPPPPPPPIAATPEDPYEDGAKSASPKPSVAGAALPDPTAKPADKAVESTLVSLTTEWARINRDVTAFRQQQTKLEGQLFQAQMNANSEVGGYAATIAILDPAIRPAGPSGAPNRTIIAAGFLASLAMAVVLAAARGVLLDDRLFDASEIDGLGLVPLLGVVPRKKQAKDSKPRGRRA